MELHKVVFAYVALQIVVAVIMAIFPRDEGMRSKTGITSFTPKPESAGDYFFNGLVFLLSGGGLFMEHINDRIVKKSWLERVGIRSAIIFIVIAITFIAAVFVSIFKD